MNVTTTLRNIAKQRYDELASMTTTKRTSIVVYFCKNGLDITNDKDFEFYKSKCKKMEQRE